MRAVEQVMGMPVMVDVRDLDIDPDAVARVFDWLRFVDATFSTYRDDSEICRINRRELRVDEADTTVSEVLLRCQALRLETRGYFDAWAVSPGSVDPSGLVKGWSVDRAARILEQAGARNYAIDAGGDIRLRGGALPDEHWRVGIQHPRRADRIAAVVVADDLAIATSGEYERGPHVVDPHTGCAPEGVLSVTVAGPDLARADAYATAAFAMGAAGPGWTARLPGYEALTILADETVVATRGFPNERSAPAPLCVA